MICMGMCGNGAGIGMVIIRAMRKPTQWARPRGLTACYAAGAGANRTVICAPRPGTTTNRTARSTSSVSVLSALSLTGSSNKAKCPCRSERRRRGVPGGAECLSPLFHGVVKKLATPDIAQCRQMPLYEKK